jgi:ribonuclease P protein component
MLPSTNRLTVKEFDDVLTKGGIVHNPLFWLRIVKNSPNTKISVICPKKVGKIAVLRNKYRRMVYEIIRKNHIKDMSNINAIVCVKDPIKNKNTQEIEVSLKELFVKAGIIK